MNFSLYDGVLSCPSLLLLTPDHFTHQGKAQWLINKQSSLSNLVCKVLIIIKHLSGKIIKNGYEKLQLV